MYYPIIRTKQFDLLALTMVVKAGLLHEKIVPVLEPVKDSATLKNTVELLRHNGHAFFVVDNPQVGDYKNMSEKINPIVLAENEVAHFFEGEIVVGDNVIGDFPIATSPQQIERQDGMRFLSENEPDDFFFSDAHLFFQEDGFAGFSDYGTSGATYYDKGFPQKHVNIPVVYLDPFNTLRLRHFHSDTNEDYGHVAEKFFEAAAHLDSWVEHYRDVTYISPFLDELLTHFHNQHFPGLGVIKKLTAAHHLACLNYYFDHTITKKISRW